ncbi:MAG: HPr family phosphocarrier protein [Magnetococcales bacterium]|nr:HPr family phosphocarrier protein [Magnetococcales bacterium]
MPEVKVTIVNRLGMHARASAKFVMAATDYSAKIWLRKVKGDMEVDGKSIMGIMMLAAAKGDQIIIGAKGADEQLALNELSALIGTKFGEERIV